MEVFFKLKLRFPIFSIKSLQIILIINPFKNFDIMKKFEKNRFRELLMLLPFILFGTIGLFQSCDDLFHEDPPKIHVNKGEVGDQFTYLTHFANQQCSFYGMKKTLYVNKGDPEPLIAFVYNKDKYGGVCKYTCKWDSISLRTLVDETKDRNKQFQ